MAYNLSVARLGGLNLGGSTFFGTTTTETLNLGKYRSQVFRNQGKGVTCLIERAQLIDIRELLRIARTRRARTSPAGVLPSLSLPRLPRRMHFHFHSRLHYTALHRGDFFLDTGTGFGFGF